MNRRHFNKIMLAAGTAALAPFTIARGQSPKLKIGVLLPKSGLQGLIGQSCQKGADLAPSVIKELLGVEIELLNADTETNVDTARTRAERLIQEGAHCLVGPFDSGAAAAIAQVAEQRGVPFVINIAAAPQITEQGYKFIFRNFPVATDLVINGLTLTQDLFKATATTPRSAVFMHVNDTFGQANAKAIAALLPRLNLPFAIVETISYDPAAKDLTVEVAKAKATKADFLLLVCRLNDAITLRREIVKQRWNVMGMISPGSPGMYENQFFQTLAKLSEGCISNVPWFDPKFALTKAVDAAFRKQNPKDQLRFHALNVGFT
ncbi:MAG TPA: ABC transporter substrate-binding protein, partial [Candidatus Binatus sp.]|nr:ABC transporter substrate-binding protein [Candidatus Binatus sp.]